MRKLSKLRPGNNYPEQPWADGQGGASTNTYLLALLALAAIVALAVVFSGGRGERAEEGDAARSAAADVLATPERLDPALYRGQIEALEAALFRQGAADVNTARRINHTARRLADAVRQGGEAAGPVAARTITDFADSVLQPDDVGFATLDLPATRSRWTGLRDRVFRSADWFIGGTGTGPAARTDPAMKEASVNDLRRLVERLTDLIISGRGETGYFGEIGVDVEEMSREAASLREDWEEWARGWSKRVEYAAAALPVQTAPDAPTELVEAHRELATAIHQLRLLAMADSASGVPTRAERQRLFDAADRAVQSARGLLSVL
jgi:hypothetical protein